MGLDQYREVVTVIAGAVIGLNLLVVFQWTALARHSRKSSAVRGVLFRRLPYPAVAAATLCNGVYWRLADANSDFPFNPGDLLILIPVLGFGIAAWLSLSVLAEVETLVKALDEEGEVLDA